MPTMNLAEVQQSLREYIHRYKARHGVRPVAMPVTHGEAIELLKNWPLAGFRDASIESGEVVIDLEDRVMDFEGVELFVQSHAQTERYRVYPAPPEG